MATILLFPTRHPRDAAQHGRSSLAYYNEPVAEYGLDDGSPEDAGDRPGLGHVAGLAAVPSRTLAALTEKVEVLVARLIDDDAGLCRVEMQLLASVLQDLRAFAAAPAVAPIGPAHEGQDAAIA